MIDWLKSLLAGASLKGVDSRRLVSVVVGAVLLVWILASVGLVVVPEIPGSVLALVLIVVGTSALQSREEVP